MAQLVILARDVCGKAHLLQTILSLEAFWKIGPLRVGGRQILGDMGRKKKSGCFKNMY